VFTERDGQLYCDRVPLARVAAEIGTPTYVYSLRALREGYRAYAQALAPLPHVVCYSVKANGTLAILRAFAREGSGFDIVSGGELFRVVRAGGDPRRVVFAGLGKTRDEMAQALAAGIAYPFFAQLVSPELAALLMALSSLSVTMNTLRMRWYIPPIRRVGARRAVPL